MKNALKITIKRWKGSDISLDIPKQRKIAHRNNFVQPQNGFSLASPIKRNGLIGNGYADAPLTNLSSSSASSMFTNNSSVSMCSQKTGSSNALPRSPRFQPSSPRNPVLGIGCDSTDLCRRARRNERGICQTETCQPHSIMDFVLVLLSFTRVHTSIMVSKRPIAHLPPFCHVYFLFILDLVSFLFFSVYHSVYYFQPIIHYFYFNEFMYKYFQIDIFNLVFISNINTFERTNWILCFCSRSLTNFCFNFSLFRWKSNNWRGIQTCCCRNQYDSSSTKWQQTSDQQESYTTRWFLIRFVVNALQAIRKCLNKRKCRPHMSTSSHLYHQSIEWLPRILNIISISLFTNKQKILCLLKIN